MKLPALIVSDLHLTANPADEYRWGLFPWLAKQVGLSQFNSVAILGDLTDAKDYHSAELVNRVVTQIVILTWLGIDVYILMGNHDYLKGGHAFFQFLNEMPRVKFITSLLDTSAQGAACVWLPHSKNPARDWKGYDLSHFQYVFMHQTIKGAKASNGQIMDGEELPDLSAAGKVYSGDIHVPQIIGPVEYVGSPYHVHFGDRFRPRCIALYEEGPKDLHYPSINRVTVDVLGVDDLARERLHAGDQVKVRAHLQQSELHEWLAIRRSLAKILEDKKVSCHGIELVAPKKIERVQVAGVARVSSPARAIASFVEREDWGGDMLHTGLELLGASDLPPA